MEYRLVGKFKSRRSGQIYEVKKNESDELSCSCPGWIHYRHCKHVDGIKVNGEMKVIKKLPNFLEAQEMGFGKNAIKLKEWNEKYKEEDIIPIEL